MTLKNVMQTTVTDLKVAGGVAATTTGSGIATALEMIPNDIGKLATLAGIILSMVLIYTHLRNGRLRHRKILLEIEEIELRNKKLKRRETDIE